MRVLPAGAIAVAGLAAGARPAHAQQTIFNHPSVDVLGHGRGYFEIDATFRRSPGDDRTHFEGVLPRLMWGPGSGVELGLDVGPFGADHADPYLVPGLKLRLFEGGGLLGTFAGVLGARLRLPFQRRHDVLLDGYGMIAWRAGPLRLTGGGYADYGRSEFSPGFVAYAEIFVVRLLRLAAEWWQHRDLGLGMVVSLGGSVDLYAAYLLSPSGRSSDGLAAKIGLPF